MESGHFGLRWYSSGFLSENRTELSESARLRRSIYRTEQPNYNFPIRLRISLRLDSTAPDSNSRLTSSSSKTVQPAEIPKWRKCPKLHSFRFFQESSKFSIEFLFLLGRESPVVIAISCCENERRLLTAAVWIARIRATHRQKLLRKITETICRHWFGVGTFEAED